MMSIYRVASGYVVEMRVFVAHDVGSICLKFKASSCILWTSRGGLILCDFQLIVLNYTLAYYGYDLVTHSCTKIVSFHLLP